MSATWMLGSTIVTILLACAAMALERVIALYRRVPLRWVWVAAAVASAAFMAFRLLPPRVPNIVPTEIAVPVAGAQSGGSDSKASEKAIASAPVAAASRRLGKVELPTVAPATERTLFLMWGGASAVFAALLLSAAWRLRSERREWARTDVAGTRLLLSPNFGPAIVGVLRPVIVVPHWITELDESSRRAIVAHEAEHLRAHDPQVLLAGIVMVVLMPWNIGLWLCWRGLRRTIELDCDARVLAGG
jgi:bla regulator protein BlaR1